MGVIFSADHAIDYGAVPHATEQKPSLELRAHKGRNVGGRNNAVNQILVGIEHYEGAEVQFVVGGPFNTSHRLDIRTLFQPHDIILNSTFRCTATSAQDQLRRFSYRLRSSQHMDLFPSAGTKDRQNPSCSTRENRKRSVFQSFTKTMRFFCICNKHV